MQENQYKDILAQATPHRPNFSEKHLPDGVRILLEKVRGMVLMLGMVAPKVMRLRRAMWQSELNQWKYVLISEMFHFAQLPSRLHRFLDNPKYATEMSPWQIIPQWLNLILKDVAGWHNGAQIDSLRKAYSYMMNFINIRKYTTLPKYSQDPKQLLADIHGIPASRIKGSVTVDIERYALIFYIQDKDAYNTFHGFLEWYENSGWFFGGKSDIKDLKWCLSYQNWIYNPRDSAVKMHEMRHVENRILSSHIWIRNYDHWEQDQKNLETMLEYAKDEVIAYLTSKYEDGDTILWTLRLPEEISKTHLYDYRKNIIKIENIWTLTQDYNARLSELVEIAIWCKAANIPNYLDLLAIVPAKNWWLIKMGFLNPKKYVKYNKNRASPWYFDHFFDSIQDEYDTLVSMYNLYPEHVVRPYYFDPHQNFYIMEKYGINHLWSIKHIPKEIFDSIHAVIRWIHDHGIAHGDLWGNILFDVDGKWVVVWFKIIDPIGISQSVNAQYFEQAKMADNEFLENFLKNRIDSPCTPQSSNIPPSRTFQEF